MPQTCLLQHEGRLPIREVSHHAGPSSDLPHDPLLRVVGFNGLPVLTGKVVVTGGLVGTVPQLLSGLFQFHGFQFGDDGVLIVSQNVLCVLKEKTGKSGRYHRRVWQCGLRQGTQFGHFQFHFIRCGLVFAFVVAHSRVFPVWTVFVSPGVA